MVYAAMEKWLLLLVFELKFFFPIAEVKIVCTSNWCIVVSTPTIRIIDLGLFRLCKRLASDLLLWQWRRDKFWLVNDLRVIIFSVLGCFRWLSWLTLLRGGHRRKSWFGTGNRSLFFVA